MSSLYKERKIQKLEERIQLEFNDKSLIRRALTHKSFPNENKDLNLRDNERLEFLGDSVLSLTISTYLFQRFNNYSEGKLAKMRAVLVSAPILAEKARKLNLGPHIILGRGEELTGGRDRDSILADTMEAILGAIYIDKDFNEATNFIIDIFKKDIKAVVQGRYIKDYKTLLQEVIQQDSAERPFYSVIEEKGPDHNKTFIVKVKLSGDELGLGTGSSKKEAEQKAAKIALENLEEI